MHLKFSLNEHPEQRHRKNYYILFERSDSPLFPNPQELEIVSASGPLAGEWVLEKSCHSGTQERDPIILSCLCARSVMTSACSNLQSMSLLTIPPSGGAGGGKGRETEAGVEPLCNFGPGLSHRSTMFLHPHKEVTSGPSALQTINKKAGSWFLVELRSYSCGIQRWRIPEKGCFCSFPDSSPGPGTLLWLHVPPEVSRNSSQCRTWHQDDCTLLSPLFRSHQSSKDNSAQYGHAVFYEQKKRQEWPLKTPTNQPTNQETQLIHCLNSSSL